MPGQPRKPSAYAVWFWTKLIPWVVVVTILILTNWYDME